MNSSTSPTAIGKPGSSTAQQIRELLHKHLRQSARFIKLVELMMQVCLWLSGFFALWLAAAVIDHWLIPLPGFARWSFWIGGVGGSIWWAAWYLFPLLGHKINPVYAARRIEQAIPEFKDGLVSWLELEQLPDNGVPRGIMAGLARHAARFLHGEDPSTTVDSSGLIRAVGVLLLLFASLVVYTMASPKSVAATGRRILMPWLALEAPTRVQIVQVKPGSCEVTQGQPLRLEVTLRGLRRGEQVSARFSTLDGQLRGQTRGLQSVTEGYNYAGSLSTGAAGVENELDYWIAAGDAQAGPFRVTISPLPAIEVEQIKLVFPNYTSLPERIVSSGQVEAVEGTKATILARANQQITRARLEIDPQVDAAGELIRAGSLLDMQVDDRQITATLPLRINAAGKNPTEIKYRVRGFNTHNHANERPVIQSLRVLADLPPEISLIGPENRLLKVMNNSLINLEIHASDPDFGLKLIVLDIKGDNASQRRELLAEAAGVLGRQVVTYRLDLAELNANVGDRFDLVASAHDNRHDPDAGKWSPNVTHSAPLALEVVEPRQFAAEPPQSFIEEPNSATTVQSEPKPGDSPNADGDIRSTDGQGSTSNALAAGSKTGGQNSQSEQKSGKSGDSSSDQSQSGAGGADSSPGAQGKSKSGKGSGSRDSGTGSPNSRSSSKPSSDGEIINRVQEYVREKHESPGADGSEDTSSSGQSKGGESTKTQPKDGKSSAGQSQSGKQSGDKSGGGDPKSGQSQGGESQAGESGNAQTGDGKSGGGQPASGQQTGGKSGGGESKSGQSQGGESKGGESGNAQAGDGKSGAGQTASGQQTGGKSGGGDSKSGQSQGGQSKGGESKGGEPKGGESGKAQAGDGKSGAGQPASGQQTGGKSGGGESKGGESKGGESKGGESKGGESGNPQSERGKSGAGQPASGQQTGGKSGGGESKSGQSQGGESKGGESGKAQAGDGKSGAGQPASGQQTGGKSDGGDSKSGQPQGGESKTGESGKAQTGDGKSGAGQPASGQQTGGKSGGGESKSGQSQGGESKGGESGKAQAGDGKSGAGQTASGQQTGGKSGGGESKSSQSQGGESKGGESGKAQAGDGKSGAGQTASGQQTGGKSGGGQSKGGESGNSQSQSGKSGAGQSESGQSSSGKPGGGQPSGSTSSGGKSGSSGRAGQPTGSSELGSTDVGSGQIGGGSGEDAPANEEYAKKATDMVLDFLDRQKDQPDPELLKRLEWSPQDLKDFVNRWQKARQLADSPDPNQQREWNDKLRDLGLNPPGSQPHQATSADDKLRGLQESATRIRPPESLRKQYEAFRKAMQEQSGQK